MPTTNGFQTGEVLTAANTNGYLTKGNRNYIINPDFYINQRAFSSSTSSPIYGFDRWRHEANTGTVGWSAQTFSAGEIAGQDGSNYIQIAMSGQSATGGYTLLEQFIESVRTLAGQTVTLSFWAKCDTAGKKIAIEVVQHFGTGGSPSASTETYGGQVTISDTWQRVSLSFAVPSISGKTIGTTTDGYLALYFWLAAGSNYASRTGSLGVQANTFQIWGVQLEAGGVATPFQIPNRADELAKCQRYYQILNTVLMAANYLSFVGNTYWGFTYVTEMRAVPSVVYSQASVGDGNVTMYSSGGGTVKTPNQVGPGKSALWSSVSGSYLAVNVDLGVRLSAELV